MPRRPRECQACWNLWALGMCLLSLYVIPPLSVSLFYWLSMQSVLFCCRKQESTFLAMQCRVWWSTRLSLEPALWTRHSYSTHLPSKLTTMSIALITWLWRTTWLMEFWSVRFFCRCIFYYYWSVTGCLALCLWRCAVDITVCCVKQFCNIRSLRYCCSLLPTSFILHLYF